MKDKIVKSGFFLAVLSILLIVAGMLYSLAMNSLPAIEHFGFWDFLTSSDWDSREGGERYGALSPLSGTILVAFLALIISVPFSISISIYFGYAKVIRIREYIQSLIDFAARIPMVIWGVWGYFTIRPLFLSLNIGEFGFSIFTAAIVLSMMITPYIASLSIAYIKRLPQTVKEAAYSLGATRAEVMWYVSLPYTRNGLIYAHLLALSKLLGESIIVTILIGNINKIPTNVMGTGNTIGSLLVDQIGSSGDLKLSVLFALALMLFLMTAIINMIANYILRRTSI